MATTAEIIARLVDLFTLNTSTDVVSPNFALGPMMSVTHTTNQTITSGTPTKLNHNIKNFDTTNDYDATTNFRYTPKKAGKYRVTAQAAITLAGGAYLLSMIYKNGASVGQVRQTFSSAISGNNFTTVTKTIPMNGTTDYLEHWAQADGTSPTTVALDFTCFFEAQYVGP
jgi:hypothetical protein